MISILKREVCPQCGRKRMRPGDIVCNRCYVRLERAIYNSPRPPLRFSRSIVLLDKSVGILLKAAALIGALASLVPTIIPDPGWDVWVLEVFVGAVVVLAILKLCLWTWGEAVEDAEERRRYAARKGGGP